MNKKLIKLIKKPRLYFTDFLKKKFRKFRESFSVVTCNYNNCDYIDDFFKSILADFDKNSDKIEIIVIDDGSTDNSREKLLSWQRRFPNQIQLIFNAENQGISYSRNKGIARATKNWICFFDIDDFVSKSFFKELDIWLEGKDKRLALIFLKVIEYHKNNIKKEHPLNYRFNGKSSDKLIRIRDYEEITQSSTTSIFRRDLITKQGILFDERVKVFFEDGKFELEYMLNNPEMLCGYFKIGHYGYRKKMSSSSISFNSWECKERYNADLKYALEILDKYNITDYVKRKLFYELFWFVKYSINKPISQYVHPDQIEEAFTKFYSCVPRLLFNSYNKCGYWQFYRVGLLGRYKNAYPYYNFLYIDSVNTKQGKIVFRFYSYFKDEENLQVLHKGVLEREIKLTKRVTFNLFERHSVYANIYILEISRLLQDGLSLEDIDLKFTSNNSICSIDSGGIRKQQYRLVDLIDNYNKKKYGQKPVVDKFKRFIYKKLANLLKLNNAWLFMDRDVWADDSAEILFRWISKNHHNINAVFAVNKDVTTYRELKKSGLRVVPFGGLLYKVALNNCILFISSHIDNYQLRGLLRDEERPFQYVFLQHGVIKDDISGWLNRKQIDYFLTSTKDEYKYITEDGPFKFTSHEVHLHGLPRHDLLEDCSSVENPKIVIMPTWRQSLSLCKTGSDQKIFNPEFSKSEFAQTWKKFLHSSKLRELNDLGIEIIFCPHANLQIYLEWFDIPSWMTSFNINSGLNIRDIFKKANLMITDSSSAAFEMAVMKKPVIYYQFDMEQMWAGSHIAHRGYFLYEKMGFGPVVKDQQSLICELQKLIDSDFKLSPFYEERFRIFAQTKEPRCRLIFDDIIKMINKI